jgi:hypothetical protein
MPFRCRSLAVLSSVLYGFSCLGQAPPGVPQQTEHGKKYALSGTVTNAATGEPIRRALVHVNGPVQWSSFTGPDGRFQFTGIPGGQVFVTAERPGFFDQQSLHGGSYPLQNASVTVSPGTNELHLQLTPEATIRGRVLDPEDEPVEGLQLLLIAQEIQDGRKVLQPRGSAETDENGTYRMEGLISGRYFVRTMVRPLFAASWAASANAYPPQYYPNGPDLSSAQTVELKGGQEAEANFSVHLGPTAVISGVVSGPRQNWVSITYDSGEGQDTGINYMYFDPATGKFGLRMVPFGSWTLHFNSNDAQGNAYYAEQDINVNRSEIAGLQVVLQSLPTIPVLINHAAIAESASPASASAPVNEGPGVQVQLLPSNPNGERYSASPQPSDPQGALVFQGVHPGKYQVVAQAFGPDCIESVSTGGVDLSRNDLLISPGSQPQPITISLRNDCATLTGAVRSESPAAGALVLLVPDSPHAEPQLVPLQSNANFTVANLSPGTYRVWAFSSIAGLEYANPDVLREYSSQQVELAPGQKSNINLDLVVRGNQ